MGRPQDIGCVEPLAVGSWRQNFAAETPNCTLRPTFSFISYGEVRRMYPQHPTRLPA